MASVFFTRNNTYSYHEDWSFKCSTYPKEYKDLVHEIKKISGL